MIEIRGSNADDLFINISKQLLDKGHETSPRGLKTLELDDTWLVLENPNDSTVNLHARNLSRKYLNAELDWYKTGSYDVNEIGKHSKFWYNLQDNNGKVNSNYGQIALRDKNEAGKTQYNWCLEKLITDKDSRQAVINYNQPRHKTDSNKDFPCTLTQTFRQRDGKLDSNVVMRSNDLIFGLSYDLPWFTYLQTKLAEDLDLEVGVYNHLANSLHVYEKHFKMLKEIANSKLEDLL